MVDGTLTHRSMNEEINLHATTDASVWASEFLNVIKKVEHHTLASTFYYDYI